MPNEPENDLASLTQDFQDAVNRNSDIGERQDVNWKSRYNVWAGQSPDGRKHKARLKEEPFPWENAFDMRCPIVDTYVVEEVDMLTEVFYNSRIQAYPIESNDSQTASTTTNLIRHMAFNEMVELDEEVELAANYYNERGKVVIQTAWERDIQLAAQEYEMGELIKIANEAAAQGKPEILEFVRLIEDPLKEDKALAMAQQVHMALVEQEFKEFDEVPEVPKKAFRKLIRDLRKKGQGMIPVPSMLSNRPVFTALRLNYDFFTSDGASDLQKNRQVFFREMIPEAELRSRFYTHGYDEDWIEKTIETAKGRMSITVQDQGNDSKNYHDEHGEDNYMDYEHLFEVVHAYQRVPDEYGIPLIEYKVFSPFVTAQGGDDLWAKEDILEYEHGKYPFTLIRKERLSRRVDDSRGIGEAIHTLQDFVKTQWDARGDRTSITTLPPLLHPVGRGPTKWGPGVRVPYTNRQDFLYADVPKYDGISEEMENRVRWQMDRYIGRAVDGVDPMYSRVRLRRTISRWLQGWRQAFTQMFQLCQQYMPEEFYYRVVGSDKAKPIRATRDEIRGKFDLHLTFSALQLDPEMQQNMLGLIEKVITTWDTTGGVDRHEALIAAFEMIDPNLGERLVLPEEAASAKEVADEKNVLSQMLNGIHTDVQPGQAFQLRAQVLQNEIQSNPIVQAKLSEDPNVQELVKNRMDQFAFQIQQTQENPQIGRTGPQPKI